VPCDARPAKKQKSNDSPQPRKPVTLPTPLSAEQEQRKELQSAGKHGTITSCNRFAQGTFLGFFNNDISE